MLSGMRSWAWIGGTIATGTSLRGTSPGVALYVSSYR